MSHIIIVWGLWGPYHSCRFEALRDHAVREGHRVTGVSLFSGSAVNKWRSDSLPKGVEHFDLGNDETRLPLSKIGRLLAIPGKLKADVALLPSYFHWSLALNVGARWSGTRVVMMNETHAGTVRASGYKAAIKQQIVKRFDAAFVGGAPQCRYFNSLGIPAEKIFIGYDVVDNDYFAARAAEVRRRASEVHKQYELPEHYFLSLGRFAEKKNLSMLVRGYQKFLAASPENRTHLVLVGSGEEDAKLRDLCHGLKLPIYEKQNAGKAKSTTEMTTTPGVHFYGFRQIDENPLFYALADAFVLPSLWEEWGLVVNEAMACRLPVIVSETAGCAEDLLKAGENGFAFDPRSADSLAAAMQKLAASPVLRETMGSASRALVEHYSCATFARNALLSARAAMGERITTSCYLAENQRLVENS